MKNLRNFMKRLFGEKLETGINEEVDIDKDVKEKVLYKVSND